MFSYLKFCLIYSNGLKIISGSQTKALAQLLSCVWRFATPWTVACQASLSFIISLSLLMLMSIELVMSSKISSSSSLFSFCLQSFPASGSLLRSQLFTSAGQSIGASASTSVLAMNNQGWFPLGLTGLISFLSKGHSRIFSNTTVQKQWFFSAQTSLWSNSHILTWLLGERKKKKKSLTRWNFVGKVRYWLFSMLSRFVTAFIPEDKCILISWL